MSYNDELIAKTKQIDGMWSKEQILRHAYKLANALGDMQRAADENSPFDRAIDVLLNGRMDPEYKQAVFDYQDGKITLDHLKSVVA